MTNVEERVREHEVARTATLARVTARERHAKALEDLAHAREALDARETELAAVTEAGDPDGKVPKLTAKIREAGTAVADAEAVAKAAERAVDGALRSEARATLDGMREEWAGRPVEKVAARVVSASSDLAVALHEYGALETDRDRLRSWGVHLVSRVLDGDGTVPPLELPDPFPRPKLAALRRVVDAIRSDLPTPEAPDD